MNEKKITSCYMDEQPMLSDKEVYFNDELIAIIKVPTRLDMLEITKYGKIETVAEAFPNAIKVLIKEWASSKPISYESLLEMNQNIQNTIFNAINAVIVQANSPDEAILGN